MFDFAIQTLINDFVEELKNIDSNPGCYLGYVNHPYFSEDTFGLISLKIYSLIKDYNQSRIMKIYTEKNLSNLVHVADINSFIDDDIRAISKALLYLSIRESFFDMTYYINFNIEQSRIINNRLLDISNFDEKSNLFRISSSEFYGNTILSGSNNLILFHPFFRRGFGGDMLYEFLHSFIEYCKNDSSNKYQIALDHYRLCDKNNIHRIVALDTWYGASFNLNNLFDKFKIGSTMMIRDERFNRWAPSKVILTEIYTTFKDGLKTMEIEEITDNTLNGYFANHYTHMQIDVLSKKIIHYDGAIKIYEPNNYQIRKDNKIRGRVDCYKYIKLFRIDGDIDLHQFIDLTMLFFRNNELVMEYFDNKQYQEYCKRHFPFER